MSSGFPPTPVYPNATDSDYTLFQVYNTSETVTVSDTDAFSEELPIRPQPGNKPEIWADNGYATISGELFYYDAVDENSEDRVCRLRRCVRNLGGRKSQFNATGTWVRGFVVAEHHNQLADCILLIENFIGENFSTDPVTLDWRIRHLAATNIISDDATCPNVEFDFNVLSSSPVTGTLASYAVNIQGQGNFTLQFGDGQSTSSAKSGTHQYAPGAEIDPVVVLQNDTCQTIQTFNVRTNPNTPSVGIVQVPFFVPVPIPPVIPPIVIPSIIIPPPSVNIPPVVFPCITPFNIPSTILPPINIPSHIDITPIHIPSQITITPIHIPSRIIGPNINVPSQIQINQPNFPDMIPIGPAPPIAPIQIQAPNIPPVQMQSPNINITGPDLPSVIEIIAPNLPSTIPIIVNVHSSGGLSLIHSLTDLQLIHDLPKELKVAAIPDVKLDTKSVRRVMKVFGQSFAETLADALKVSLPDFSQMKLPHLQVEWGEVPTIRAVLKVARPKQGVSDDGITGAGKREPEFEHVDFPTSIPVTVPEIPPLKVEHNIPTIITLDTTKLRNIRLDASLVPTEIKVVPPKEGLGISVIPFTLPSIKIDTSTLDEVFIPIKIPDAMPKIQVQFPDEMPTLKIEFPKDMPTLKVEIPDNARIPLFYDGPPLPVQVNLRIQNLAGEAADNIQCVAIIPCAQRR